MTDDAKTREDLLAELQALRESECQFREFVENAPVGIYRTTPDGTIILANSALIRMLGYASFEELANRNLESNGFEPDYPRGEFRRRIEQNGEVRGLEVAWKRRDGTTIYLSENARLVRDGKGDVLYYEGVVEDISERKKATEQVEAANRAKDVFLANMGHELRTPLTGILGVTDLMLEGTLDSGMERNLRTIKSSAKALSTLIDDLLDFSRIERGRLSLASEPFSLRAVLEEVVQILRFAAEEKRIELRVCLDAGIPNRLVGDAGRIRQVLLNLIDNAIKFTSSGHVDVTASCEESKGVYKRVSIEVRDTGIGIPDDKLREIFDKFTQVNGSSSRRFAGTGLGLAICKQMVELMGGTLKVESRPGAGSVFSFTLDLVLPKAEPERHDAGETRRTGREGAACRVLVVEDDKVNQEVIATILRKLGCQVDLASSGIVAMRMLGQQSYDLIFMDCQMPGMDGFEVTERIRRQEEDSGGRIKIVAITAYSLDEDRQRCLASGMDEHIAKPATMNDFRRVLKRFGCL